MSFVPFMLCERLTDMARLHDRRYIAEPKLDGQRAQLHVRESAVLDGEACAGDGDALVMFFRAHRSRRYHPLA